MQAWIRTITPSLFVCCAANRRQRLIMFFELFIVLRSLSALWALGFASLCKHNSPIRYASWAKHSQGWMMNIPAVGLIGSLTIILAMGYWLLAIDWGMGLCRYLCLYALRPTLYTKSDSDHASNLSPHRLITLTSNLILCQRQCFDADAIGRCKSGTK